MGATLKSIKMARCNDDGTIVDNPVVIDLCVESSDVKIGYNYVDVNCLLSKTSDKKQGSSTIDGSLTFNLNKQTAYLLHLLVLGQYTSKVDDATDDWAADTEYHLGDKVNHSNDTHTLTCTRVKDDSKSGSDEPTTEVTNSTKITQDNNVTWAITPLFKKTAIELQDTPIKVAIEFGIDDGTGGDIFYKRYEAVEFVNLPISVENTDKVPQYQVNIVGNSFVDSTDSEWTTPLDGIAGAKMVHLGRDYYSANTDDTTTLALDGNYGCVQKFDLTLDKGVTVKKGLNKCSISTRDIKADGNISLDFTVEEYKKYKNNESFTVDLKIADEGCYIEYVFDTVKAETVDPVTPSRTEVMLDPPIWAVSNPKLVGVTIVYPEFMADDGTLVEF